MIEQFYQWLSARRLKLSFPKDYVFLFLVGISLSIAIAACSGNNADTSSSVKLAAGRDVKLKLVSYSVTKAAYDQIIPKFVEKWKQYHNQNVTFDQSYGGSGSQTDAVINSSQQADVVHLSLALDINKKTC
jgi:sulfate transport system substrate-binding protein